MDFSDSFLEQLVGALPILAVVVMALLMLFLDLCKLWYPRLFWGIAACLAGVWSSGPQLFSTSTSTSSMFFTDGFNFVFNAIILGGTIISLLLTHNNLDGQRVRNSVDIDILMLLTAAGAMVMVSAANLFVFFIGFELLSVCVYVLTAASRAEKASSEAGLKYFVLGAFSSAFLLYGITLIYAASGSVQLVSIVNGAINAPLLFWVAVGLIIFGLGFKIGLVPFHFWTPDVYQGAPTSISAFMAVVVKSAAIGAFFRVVSISLASLETGWVDVVWLLAVVTMTVGNLLALRQTSIKRMLAYSSVAHAGYLAMGFLLPGNFGPLAFYLIAYGLMSLSAFGVALLVSVHTEKQYSSDSLDSFKNLGWRSPMLGIVMTIALLSLAGMPPLAGFMGKFYLFASVAREGFLGLVIIAALNSVLSLYYYLRVIVVMYFADSQDTTQVVSMPWASATALLITTLGTLYVGIFAGDVISYL